MKKLVFIKTILFFVVLQPVFAEKISIIRDPIYSYKLSTGPVEAVYSTPEEAIQGLQAYYNEHQNPHPAQPHRRLYAPYPSVDSSITNGRPNTWIWDYDVYYPASPELDYSGSTGVVNMGVNCPSAPAFENSAWVMRGERVTSQNVKIWCEVDFDRPEQPPSMCERDSGKFGNPVNIYSRAKQHEEPIYQDFSPGGLYFSWHYESRPANKIIDHTHAGVHGYWRHSFEYELRRVMEDVYVLTSPNAPKAIFWKNKLMGFDSGWLSSSSYMEPVGGGQISAVRNTSTGTTYYFNHHGKVLQISSPDNRPGIQFSLEYDSSNRLVEVRDRFGKVIQFGGYLGEKLGKIITPDGNVFSFLHQENNLYRVDFGNGEYTTYLYEEQDRRNLTGYAVAGGEKLAHYVYDSQGRAISTELVGGINKFHFKYYSWDPYFTEMTTPLGSVVRINFSAMSGNLLVANISSPPPGAASAIASASFNASGLKAWEDDFLGNRKSFEWNTIRRFPEKITLAANSPDAKATEIEWHTAFDLPSRIAEPSREARREYDAGGNLLRETLATAGGAWSRHWTYAQDLATSHTDEAGNTYIYGYDSRGNLTTVTDPAGLSTQYTHDGAGRVITVTEPSGSIRQYTYDHRGRTTSASVNGLLTSYTYSLQGLLEKTVYPNGYVVFHDYDPVRRPIGWHDNRGARKILTLDNAGNAVDEAWETASAVPVYKIQRVFNSSGQLTQVIRGNSTSISYALDGNGDLSGVVLGSGGRTDYSRDGLRRVYRLRDQNGHSATIDYDPFGAVAKATDFAKVATSYTRDALGNALQEVSPDAGNITATHDERGLLASITEASGRTTTYTRDALGRPTLLQYADGTRTLLRYDLPGSPYNAPGAPNASVGHLSEIQHPGATTQYQRDLLGRITRKTQALASGDMKTASYTYVPAGQGGAGQLASITYPSGRQLAYQYDATGQLTSLQWSGQPLLANLTWNPLGQPTGWRWPGIAGGLTEVRQYDTAGQLTRTSLLDLAWDGAGRITAIQQSQMVPSSAGQAPQTARIGSAYSYDLIGRLTASAHALQGTPALAWPTGLALADVTGYASMGYGYDANGNRLSDVRVRPLASGNSLTTIRTHAIAAGTNRLSGITTVGDSSAAIGYGYDATGAITSATRQGTTYHLHYGADGRIARLTASGNAADLQAVSYHYNGLGQRIAKTDTRASTSAPHIEHTLYSDEDGTQPLGTYGNQRSAGSAAPAGESDSTEVIYLPTAAGLMPIAAHINGRLYAIHTDHLNTPRRLTNAQGQVAWQWLVTGFGEVNPTTGAGGYLQQGNGYTYSEPVTFNLRYPGQQWDEETGLAYNLHRYYDAQNGRYIQADPIGLEGGWNRFAYVEGNPLSLIDPEGLQFLDLTTLAGLRRETTLDDAVRAGGWTRAITMPVVTAGLTPSAIGLVGYSSAPLLCSTTTTVTSWAPAGVVPDLAAGRWVMQGGPNVWNYIRTGVWGPRFTQGQGFSWQPYPISNSVTGTATVGWPSGIANFWRGIFGQRQVTP